MICGFKKKWIDDCDEAEKIMIGKCAFKAYSATNVVCTVLAIVLAVCALVFDIGFLPSLYGLPCLDRQSVGVLQGGKALLKSWE